jgi:NADH:ubiquinone oxidoreductase subunit 5 (subunit L)/multisubunit Na+/H+ antiporter MnhA subunit
MKVNDIKAVPPTPTSVLLYLQIMVSLGIPLLTEQFIVIEYPAVACIIHSFVSVWTAMSVGLSALNTKI